MAGYVITWTENNNYHCLQTPRQTLWFFWFPRFKRAVPTIPVSLTWSDVYWIYYFSYDFTYSNPLRNLQTVNSMCHQLVLGIHRVLFKMIISNINIVSLLDFVLSPKHRVFCNFRISCWFPFTSHLSGANVVNTLASSVYFFTLNVWYRYSSRKNLSAEFDRGRCTSLSIHLSPCWTSLTVRAFPISLPYIYDSHIGASFCNYVE